MHSSIFYLLFVVVVVQLVLSAAQFDNDIGRMPPRAGMRMDQLCKLPPQTGLCRARMPRWYYNQEKKDCEEFVFGGCGGNGNNFLTQEGCLLACKG